MPNFAAFSKRESVASLFFMERKLMPSQKKANHLSLISRTLLNSKPINTLEMKCNRLLSIGTKTLKNNFVVVNVLI